MKLLDRIISFAVFSVLATLPLAIYPKLDVFLFRVTGHLFYEGIASHNNLGAGLIHWPSVALMVLMFLAYTATPAVVSFLFRLVDRAQGLTPEPVKVVARD